VLECNDVTMPAMREVLGERRARLTLGEGKAPEVQRLFCGPHAVARERTRFGSWTLSALPKGSWRACPGRAESRCLAFAVE
jgi:16S rRNA pseudouridine516 synthase